ncbi:uncharacterized protein BDZ99DRAFT_111585 [Mytilinidion resinicola]|uniref:S-adenosyl-L-methionine-dependent methyltransferase n=1 Tax=Mytilinidion resinicola TaxID=574789 RepID=A0A6A6Y900_9PEZI|nr:uncharacterized protein BDZ99DRAFT_111585 [Mytilinidion resinicola]KAF2805023.1 hypothetical protein BDZ99DRAFT_111585 [Mytilinidion resinicola]
MAATTRNTGQTALPPLDNNLVHHPDSCLGLSLPLIERIARILPHNPRTIVSIGSGTGLFEALLLHHEPDLTLYGVEVGSDLSINKYIPEQYTETVGGTWDLCSLAESAAAWMFVYPRSPKLVAQYLERYASSKTLEMVVWLGPREDWTVFEPCFSRASMCAEISQDALLRPYEMMAIYKTKT